MKAKIHKREYQAFDMSHWNMGEDIESMSSFPAADFRDQVEKLAESFSRGLEGKFDNAVRDGVSMALSFIAESDLYCGFHYSDTKDERNPDGVPSIGFYFGDDYADVEPFTEFLESCDSDNLETLLEIIVDVKCKRIKEKELRKNK